MNASNGADPLPEPDEPLPEEPEEELSEGVAPPDALEAAAAGAVVVVVVEAGAVVVVQVVAVAAVNVTATVQPAREADESVVSVAV